MDQHINLGVGGSSTVDLGGARSVYVSVAPRLNTSGCTMEITMGAWSTTKTFVTSSDTYTQSLDVLGPSLRVEITGPSGGIEGWIGTRP